MRKTHKPMKLIICKGKVSQDFWPHFVKKNAHLNYLLTRFIENFRFHEDIGEKSVRAKMMTTQTRCPPPRWPRKLNVHVIVDYADMMST